MATKIKPLPKFIGLGLLGIAAFLGIRHWQDRPKDVGQAQQVGRVSIPDAPEASLASGAVKLDLPGKEPALNGGPKIVINEMAWQAQTSINYANGGDRTTKGSLFDKAHLDVQIIRQDDCTQTVTDFVKWTNDYKNGATKDGFFAIFMGSGVPAYIHAMSEALKGLDAAYQPVAIADTVYVLAKETGKEGGTIVKEIDLIERNLAWHPDVKDLPAFKETIQEIKGLL